MKSFTPLLSIIGLVLSFQTFAQTRIHVTGELTTLNDVNFGNISIEIEKQIEVDWSGFFGIKTYSMVLPMDYSMSGDLYPKIRQVGVTGGFNYYILPHLGLQVNADLRGVVGVSEGVQQLSGIFWTPEKPKSSINADLGLLLTTRWVILPLPKFMKLGIGARYVGLLNSEPVVINITETSARRRSEVDTSGFAFTINLHFIFNAGEKKKL